MSHPEYGILHHDESGVPDAALVGFDSEESAQTYLQRLLERSHYDLDRFSVRAWIPGAFKNLEGAK